MFTVCFVSLLDFIPFLYYNMLVPKQTRMIPHHPLDYDSSVADIFFGIGMHCVGCPASRGETIEEAAMVHGVAWEPIVEALNARLK